MNPNPEITFGTRIRKSPFFDSTLKWGCKGFTVYNKMYMPTYYASYEEDYWSLVKDVTLWDVGGERQVKIKGPDAQRFVEYLTPRDISKCKIGQCMYVLLTEKNGGIVNDPILLKIADNHFWLSIADSDVLLWCLGIAASGQFNVKISEPEVSPLALQGPKAQLLMKKISGQWIIDLKFYYFQKTTIIDIPVIIARSGWSGEIGYEIYLMDESKGNQLWEHIMEQGEEFNIKPATPNQISRVECGLLSYGSDMSLNETPYDINMAKFVDLNKKADCLSREALVKIEKEKKYKKLIGIELPDDKPMDYSPDHQPIISNNKVVGKITSSVYSPRLKKNIALGLVEYHALKEYCYIDSIEEKNKLVFRELPFLRNK